ncbi:LacI family transcriptional regulator [bacterium D16-54]|nr:LacI family transcriptional regulator [bacterium D16-54]RKJ15052.1 LacI family transcriptional regulator [bacterium D16-56]
MNIAEIARRAGVSSAAVSRYFNHGYISEEKREKIRLVVEETGYRPSLQAQTLRTRKTKLIGVILPKIDSAVAIGNMVAGILSVLNEKGYQLLLADTQNNPEKELEYLSVFNEKQVDGVIFIATVFSNAHKKALKNMQVPAVLAGQLLPGFHCVYHDDYHAVYDMTRLVLERGRNRLGFVSVLHQDRAAGLERYRGFCDAVREFGLENLENQYVIADFTMESGYEKGREMWKKFGSLDGILCATDSIAIGVMQYLKEQGMKIPEDVMVTGHGDSLLSKVVTPTLTTIRYSYEESGRFAASMLLEILEKGESSAREIKMGYELVEKESTNDTKA